MAVEITTRHLELTAGGKEYLRGKAEEIIGEFPNVENIHVIVDGHGHRKLSRSQRHQGQFDDGGRLPDTDRLFGQ